VHAGQAQGSPQAGFSIALLLLPKAAKLPIQSVAAQRYRSSYASARLELRSVRVLTGRSVRRAL